MKKTRITVKSLAKAFCISLLAAMLLWSCAAEKTSHSEDNFNETGFPIVDQEIQLEVGVMRASYTTAYADMPRYQDLEEKTNIKIKWREIPVDSFEEKINLMFASSDFPDIMLREISQQQILDYSASGDIIPLDDLIEKYAPNWIECFKQYPYVEKSARTLDGKIYSLPFVRMEEAYNGFRDVWMINKTWLDNCGLEMPKTTEQFKEVLKAFKTGDPNENGINDEIPWTFIFNEYANGHFDIFGSFDTLDYCNSNASYHIGLKDGKVFYSATTPESKETLKYLRDLYSEGLIDMESFTQNGTQFRSKLKNDPEIIGSFTSFLGSEVGVEKVQNEIYVPLEPLVGPSGNKPKFRRQTGQTIRGCFTIFKNNKYPRESVRWANELADPEFGLDATYGPLVRNDDGTYTALEKKTDELASTASNFGPFIVTDEYVDKINNMPYTLSQRRKFYEVYKPYVVSEDEIYPAVFFTHDQRSTLSRYEIDLTEYVKNTQAKWITQGGIDEEWDSYVQTIKNMNVDEVLNIYQEALDSFNQMTDF